MNRRTRGENVDESVPRLGRAALWAAERSSIESEVSKLPHRSEVPPSSDAYGPPSERVGETGVAPWKARERDSTGCRSGATGEREVSEGSRRPGICVARP